MISVVIHTYNAASVIRPTLDSVKDFDEIIICDMESTDDTLAIAREYNCRILSVEKKNYTVPEPYRNFAIHEAKNEWVLVLDADEIIPDALKKYILEEVQKNEIDGLSMPRKNFFMHKFTKAIYPDYQLRLFKKSLTTWAPNVHSKAVVNGNVKIIPAKREDLAILHKSDTVSNMFNKINLYTDNEMARRPAKDVSGLELLFSPFFRFLKVYFLKGGIRYGKIGFVQACRSSIYKFAILLKQLERANEEKMRK